MNVFGKLKVVGLVILLSAAVAVANAQTFTTLFEFDSTHGANPGSEMQLVQGLDGNLWGTTESGGVYVGGTIFRISIAGGLTTEFDFTSSAYGPTAGLTLAPSGLLYGTTNYGGPDGVGAFFSFSPKTRNLVTLSRGFGGIYGSTPLTGVIRAFNGTFYGITSNGGASIVFLTSANGYIGVVCDLGFEAGLSTLAQSGNGNFYGTSNGGGPNGTVFEVTPGGTLTILHSFVQTDGATPFGGLAEGANGDFYGTTNLGGADDLGTIFRITPSGALTMLHNFRGSDGNYPGGYFPAALLVEGTDGNFYGTTTAGGANGFGTIFKITPAGALSTLWSFDSTATNNTSGGLMQATDGNFYGTIFAGGANGYGSVYRLSVGLAPFVRTLPGLGNVGSTVEILGTDLTGATSVTFNGTPATFTVSTSGTWISATVPAGATSGSVQVTTPSGTLQSNVAFDVL